MFVCFVFFGLLSWLQPCVLFKIKIYLLITYVSKIRVKEKVWEEEMKTFSFHWPLHLFLQRVDQVSDSWSHHDFSFAGLIELVVHGLACVHIAAR